MKVSEELDLQIDACVRLLPCAPRYIVMGIGVYKRFLQELPSEYPEERERYRGIPILFVSDCWTMMVGYTDKKSAEELWACRKDWEVSYGEATTISTSSRSEAVANE